ncbi:MAG: hypothetical protein HMLIMOIP_000864 [Candidatus Nitrosomirales archaeon]|jgi:hypothetical protein
MIEAFASILFRYFLPAESPLIRGQLSIIIAATLVTSIVITPFGNYVSAASSGKIKEIVADDSRELYVVNVKDVSLAGGGKRIDVELICKNKEATAESCLNPFYFKLRDTDGHEYTPEMLESPISSVRIPSNDIVRAVASFKIPTQAVANQLIFSELLGSTLTVSLTATKAPADSPPASQWVLSSNKGTILSDGKQELQIHDEKWSGNAYQLDISITNIGNEKASYNVFYTYVKDENGVVYDREIFSIPEPSFSSGELQPGEKVRGWLAFEVDSPKELMFIYDEMFGSYFATGKYSDSKATQTQPEIQPKPTITNPIAIPRSSLIDQLGNTLTSSEVDVPLGVKAELANTSSNKVIMSYIVQVKDSDGITVFLTWIEDLPLPANDNAKPAIFWTPTASGTYTIEGYVWKSLNEPLALSSPVSMSIKIR